MKADYLYIYIIYDSIYPVIFFLLYNTDVTWITMLWFIKLYQKYDLLIDL